MVTVAFSSVLYSIPLWFLVFHLLYTVAYAFSFTFPGPKLVAAKAWYFFGLNTYSVILPQKRKYFELFLTFFALGSNISMIISDLSKYNCQMLYQEETMA